VAGPRVGVRLTSKARWFWPLAIALLVADCATKRVVENHLTVGTPQPLVGEVVRLTLSYNTDAAMGIKLGGNSRPVLAVLSFLALVVLGVIYHRTGPRDRRRAVGVALVVGGAVGNLIDRLRSPTGVVDFIDFGVAHVRFWTFNVADMGITIGAVLLLLALGRWGGGVEWRGLSEAPSSR
jgi:signal peptidase II